MNAATLVKKSTENANRVQGFKGKEGMKEGAKHNEDDHTHDEEEEVEEKVKVKKKGKKGKKEEKKEKVEIKEGFVGLDDMKNVTNKLHNYLGFSITDLDRFMKTSGEKNTIASTKDL